MTSRRIDVYAQVTDRIVAELEAGVRPWVQPWTASHAAGEVSRPLRFNGIPYRGINVVLLWLSALRRRYASPLWMTYKQAIELGGQVRRGETGSLVVYADRITRREVNENGEEEESEIPFLKSYTVFNTEQIEDFRPIITRNRSRRFVPSSGSNARSSSLHRRKRISATAVDWRITFKRRISSRCRHWSHSRTQAIITPRLPMR